jgi:uncharacterized protein (TIGR03663 family)
MPDILLCRALPSSLCARNSATSNFKTGSGMSRSLTLGLLLLTTALALGLRCPRLDERPMHNDEAVNATKFRTLWEHGSYRYDPNEHHGPSLFYFTLAWAKCTGAPRDFAQLDETRFRMVTALFGAGLILLLALVADGLGRGATVCAGLLTAISPAMVFYSRYYIHEMLLVFFTFLALAGGWRYTRNRKIGWALLSGSAVGLMAATKETFVLALAAMAAALVLNGVWMRPTANGRGANFQLNWKHAAWALAAFVLVVVVFFSSFFSNLHGLADSVKTFLPWIKRAAGESPLLQPWYFYLQRLTFYHGARGPTYSEGLILALAIGGFVAGIRGKGLADGNAGFIRFIAFYSILLAVVYSVISYKTPWCLAGFWHGTILLAGVGAAAVLNWARQRWLKAGVGVVMLAAAGQLACQAWQASVTHGADRDNPYGYSQTSPDIFNLVDQVEALAKVTPEGHNMLVKVMAPGSDYWPLPWYLRQFSQVGWWSEMPPDPYAPVMIVSAKLHAALDENKTHIMTGVFQLRSGVFFELYVSADLWRAYLAAANGKPAAN